MKVKWNITSLNLSQGNFYPECNLSKTVPLHLNWDHSSNDVRPAINTREKTNSILFQKQDTVSQTETKENKQLII